MPKQLTAAAAARLLAHSWPGNVRELKNMIERASVLVRGSVIASDLDRLMTEQGSHALRDETVDWLAGDLPTALARLEAAMIRRALAAANAIAQKQRGAWAFSGSSSMPSSNATGSIARMRLKIRHRLSAKLTPEPHPRGLISSSTIT